MSKNKVKVEIHGEDTGKCAICNKSGVSLLCANHKDLGIIEICQDCWQNTYAENRLVSGSGSSGGCSGSCSCR